MNIVQPQIDGPLQVSGELKVVGSDGQVLSSEPEVWLCRCGQSGNKPFCDDSHVRAGFRDAVNIPADYRPKAPETAPPGGTLTLTAKANGPLRCLGPLQVQDAAGKTVWSGAQASLCRCGQSKMKPFCDGSHRAAGFQAD